VPNWCRKWNGWREPATFRDGPGVGIPLTALGYTARPMSKVCAVCGKKPGFGNNRSHSMVATKRRFNPNLQRVRVLLKGKATRAYVCTRCLKGGKVQKAI
jgi:large subunit ribosomal protein L28